MLLCQAGGWPAGATEPVSGRFSTGVSGLPVQLLDPGISIDNVLQRFPELATEIDGLMKPPEADDEHPRATADEVRRAALISKLLLNVFATGTGNRCCCPGCSASIPPGPNRAASARRARPRAERAQRGLRSAP